jgi:hypothetical protein
MRRIVFSFICAVVFLAAAPFTLARVTRIEITTREDINGGKPFGLAGPYERLIGKVYFSVDPRNPHNLVVVDLDKTDRNRSGEVEFSADVYILKPKDPSRGNGSVLLEIPNRGGRGIVRLVNFATNQSEFGDGFLMRQGITIVWVGWQFDVRAQQGLLRLYAPIARNGEKSITGFVRSDVVVPERVNEIPLGHLINGSIGGTEYPVADVNDAANVLTVRETPLGERRVIPKTDWSFAHSVNGTITPSDRYVYFKSGFEPGKIYELVYVAKDPVVVGLGLAGVRDLVSYFKHDTSTVAPARRAYALGISQSGRFLRHFVYQGFNADEEGRQVFDGLLIHVAGAGIGSFNHRFAQPSRDAQPLNALFYPTDLFPFADTPQTDPETGKTAGLLDKAKAENVLPKIFYTNTAYEYWSRAASLIHTSPDGKQDLPLMDNVRVYFFAGLQHFSGAFPPTRGTSLTLLGQQPQNPNPISWFWRAMIVNMDEWGRDGVAAPPSSYPRLDDGSLVARDKLTFTKIPDVNLPQTAHQAYRLDFGSDWLKGIISKQPPAVGTPYPVFVPQVNGDGNEMAGVRLPELVVPVATYTGWNLRDPKTGAPWARVSFIGSYFPFAKTRSERERRGDPRASLEERYQSKAQYVGLYAEAAMDLIQRRFLLREDLAGVLRRGNQEWDEAQK